MTVAISADDLHRELHRLRNCLRFHPVSQQKIQEVEAGLIDLANRACPNQATEAASMAQNSTVPAHAKDGR